MAQGRKATRTELALSVDALEENLPRYHTMSYTEREIMAMYTMGMPSEKIAAMCNVKKPIVNEIIHTHDPDGHLPNIVNLKLALAHNTAINMMVYSMYKATKSKEGQTPLAWMQTAKLAKEVAEGLAAVLGESDDSAARSAADALKALED